VGVQKERTCDHKTRTLSNFVSLCAYESKNELGTVTGRLPARIAGGVVVFKIEGEKNKLNFVKKKVLGIEHSCSSRDTLFGI
jgi:hypothetical protein